MARSAATHSLLVGVLMTAIGAVSAGAVVTALMVSMRAPDDMVRTTTRQEGTIQRDAEDTLRVQERRNARLQEEQTMPAAHESAGEEPMQDQSNDRRAYFRAERWCMLNGYANSRRLALCIHRIVETGVFENTPW